MRLPARALGVVVALGLAAAGLAGCGSTAADVHAPKFTVPTPPPMRQQGRPGSAGQASTFLTGWVHDLSRAADRHARDALERPCHGDAGCTHLVRLAATLPKPTADQYYQNWSIAFATQVTADPKHPDSWTVVIRPTWVTYDKPLDGRYDGWTTRTLVTVRLKLVGHDPQSDWRLWLTPVPGSGPGSGSLQLTKPKYGDL